MTAPAVVGLDLSLTSTGVAMPDGSTRRIRTNAADRLEERLSAIVAGIIDAVRRGHVDLVVIEDMVTASKFAGAVAPVHGAVRLRLWEQDVTVALASPASLKLYATGKGNTDKDGMKVAAQKRADLDFTGRGDECDAWWLRAMALDAYGHPVVEMPVAHRAALEKVSWPVLNQVVAS